MSLLVKEVFSALILLLIPISVHAGIFSSLAGLVNESADEVALDDEVNYSPVQTPLLSTTKIDPVAATGGGDVNVDDNALVSAGPVSDDEKAASRNGGEISVYTVREGDSLSQIAEMYGVTTNTIMWANDMSNKTIHEGQTLVILPIVGVRHKVASGETLASIVKKYEADLDEVLEYNNLASADVYIIAVSDNAIEQLSNDFPFKNQLIFFKAHTGKI